MIAESRQTFLLNEWDRNPEKYSDLTYNEKWFFNQLADKLGEKTLICVSDRIKASVEEHSYPPISVNKQ